MTPSLLSFAAGVLTVSSPCVLPVLLLLFARRGSGRLLAGLGWDSARTAGHLREQLRLIDC